MNSPLVWGICFKRLLEKRGVGRDPFPLSLYLQVLVTPWCHLTSKRPRCLLHGVAEI